MLVVLFALVDLLPMVGKTRGYGISTTRVIWVLILLVQTGANVLVMLTSLARLLLTGGLNGWRSHAAYPAFVTVMLLTLLCVLLLSW